MFVFVCMLGLAPMRAEPTNSIFSIVLYFVMTTMKVFFAFCDSVNFVLSVYSLLSLQLTTNQANPTTALNRYNQSYNNDIFTLLTLLFC